MIMSLRNSQSRGRIHSLAVIATAFIFVLHMYVGVYESASFYQQIPMIGTWSTESKSRVETDDTKRATRKHSMREIVPEPVPRPLIETLVTGQNVTGDVAWLLNMAVLGFSKCGTSFMMRYLGRHEEIAMLTDGEHCELTRRNEDSALIKSLMDGLPSGKIARGLKCPIHLESPRAMQSFSRYFPNTKIIVGVRHPVLWFESFYNYRHQDGKTQLLPAQELIGKCADLGPFEKVASVCTEGAKFHEPLARLGKTNMQSTDERQYFSADAQNVSDTDAFSGIKIFVYDLAQLQDKDHDRSQILLQDLQNFLQVTKPFQPMVVEPKRLHDGTRIDICDPEYNHLREVLVDTGVKASRWIRRFFVHAEGVTVSSPKFLDQVLAKWEEDPCEERRAEKSSAPSP
jgi:hypothetical protein